MRRTALLAPLATFAIAISACGSDAATDDTASTTLPVGTSSTGDSTQTTGPADAGVADEQRFPDVIDAEGRLDGDTWTISATLSSPYDTPERYADAWRVVGPDGTVYGERILVHDHAGEQPFTRSESGIAIPAGVTEVVIEGRDLEFGYGGTTFTLTLAN